MSAFERKEKKLKTRISDLSERLSKVDVICKGFTYRDEASVAELIRWVREITSKE